MGISIRKYEKGSLLDKAMSMRPVNPGEHDLERLQAGVLASGLELSTDEQLCAVFEAQKYRIDEIELMMGWPASWIFGLRMKADYQELVRRCVQLKSEQTISGPETPEEILNKEIKPSIATIMEVRDNPFEKGQVRLNASKEVLDRAPNSPKSRQITEQHRTVVNIPLKDFQNMQQTLLESGTPEDLAIYQLAEGRDYDVTTSETAENPEEITAIEVA